MGRGGRDPKDAGRRRAAFFIIWFIAIAAFFLYNKFVVSDKVALPNLQSRFAMTNYLSTLIVAVVYLAVGFIMSSCSRTANMARSFRRRNKTALYFAAGPHSENRFQA